MKKLSRPDRYIRDSTALNSNKRLVQPDVSKVKMFPQDVTEDPREMRFFSHGSSKYSLHSHGALPEITTPGFIIVNVAKGPALCFIQSISEQSSQLIWTKPVSTIPRLPPKTKEERLSILGDDAEETIKSLEAEKYKDALRRLDSLNDSLRNVILSGAIAHEISENLNNILDSLEVCKQVVYEGIKEGNAAEAIQQHGIGLVLEGSGKVFKAYANLDEWEERMAAEWGGDRS